MTGFGDSPLHEILELWRAASRDLHELPKDSQLTSELRAEVDALRRRYVAGFAGLQPSNAEPSPVADELAHISDDLMATVAELETLLRHRDAVRPDDAAAFDRAIDRASAEVLRLSALERQVSDDAPNQVGQSIAAAEARTPDA